MKISGFLLKLLYAVAYVCRGPFGVSRLLGQPRDGTDATKRLPPVAALRGSGFHGSLDPLRPGALLRLLQATEGNVKDHVSTSFFVGTPLLYHKTARSGRRGF